LKQGVVCTDDQFDCVQVLTSPKDIEMWGDGLQTRSFTFIDDCVEGILRITKSDYKEPLNLGSSEMVRYTPSLHANKCVQVPQRSNLQTSCACNHMQALKCGNRLDILRA
jgi:nucleoside-diphosphate-sugar epimerase